jgi:hypothetical protein
LPAFFILTVDYSFALQLSTKYAGLVIMTDEDEKKPVRFPLWLILTSRRNREIILTMLVCLLVATVMWFFNALSKDYTTKISLPVEYVNLPRNKFIINNPPKLLNLKVKAFGFALLRYKLTLSLSPFLLDVSDILNSNVRQSNGFYIINTKNISENISSKLSSEIELLDINPGVFTLAFDSLAVRVVPVGSRAVFSFKPRFGLMSAIKFEPAHVTVTGPVEVIEKTDTVFTVPKIYKNLNSTVSDEIELISSAQIFVEPKQVLLNAVVDEFTERNMSIPVWIDNQPDNFSIRLFPHEVEVSFRIGLSQYTQIRPEDFSLYISWEEIRRNSPELKVNIKKSPPQVKNLKIVPEYVEYLIEKE